MNQPFRIPDSEHENVRFALRAALATFEAMRFYHPEDKESTNAAYKHVLGVALSTGAVTDKETPLDLLNWMVGEWTRLRDEGYSDDPLDLDIWQNLGF